MTSVERPAPIPALASAREQLATQSKALVDAQQRVDELLKAQQRLKAVLFTAPTAPAGTGRGSQPDGASDAKVAELRVLLGKAVRTQAEQQQEIDRLSESLREQRTGAGNARHTASVATNEAEELRAEVQRLTTLLRDEQSERMESEAAALEREETLEGRVAELEEQERRRVELEAAMEAAMQAPPPSAAPSIKVAAAPAAPPPPGGFDASAGGFSL